MESWPKKLLQACVMVLLAMLALAWAIDLFRCLLPWLVGIGVMAGLGWLVWWWFRRRWDQW
jgi:hypothetical protein